MTSTNDTALYVRDLSAASRNSSCALRNQSNSGSREGVSHDACALGSLFAGSAIGDWIVRVHTRYERKGLRDPLRTSCETPKFRAEAITLPSSLSLPALSQHWDGSTSSSSAMWCWRLCKERCESSFNCLIPSVQQSESEPNGRTRE